jgi:hypothetical protein
MDAVGLVVAGAALFLDRVQPSWQVFDVASRWWPVSLIILGVVGMVRLLWAYNPKRGPLLVALAGAFLLLITRDPLPSSVDKFVWPAVMALTGLLMLVHLAVVKPVGDRLVTRLLSVGGTRRLRWPVGDRRRTFTSVTDVIDAIRRFIDSWNYRCEPFA